MKTVILALLTGLGVLAPIWWYVRMDAIKAWHGLPATFTPPDSAGKPVPFEHRHERYLKVAEVMMTLASASLLLSQVLGSASTVMRVRLHLSFWDFACCTA